MLKLDILSQKMLLTTDKDLIWCLRSLVDEVYTLWRYDAVLIGD